MLIAYGAFIVLWFVLAVAVGGAALIGARPPVKPVTVLWALVILVLGPPLAGFVVALIGG